MVRLVRSIFLQSLFSALVATQGQFVVPSGPDGSNTYTVGSMLTIVWTGTESYSLLSLGINSLNNSTVTWLISNSQENPKNFLWNVTAGDFGLSATHLFQFWIVNGTDFGGPFKSDLFQIQEASNQPTGTTSGSSSATSSVTTAPSTAPSPPSNSSFTASPLPRKSASLTSGAKAGIGVGITFAFFAGISLAWWLLRSWQRAKMQKNVDAVAFKASLENGPYGLSNTSIAKTVGGARYSRPGELDARETSRSEM